MRVGRFRHLPSSALILVYLTLPDTYSKSAALGFGADKGKTCSSG